MRPKFKHPPAVQEVWDARKQFRLQAQDGEDAFDLFGVIGWDITGKDAYDFLQSAQGPTIYIDINSPGGVFDDGFAIFNLIKQSRFRVVARVWGLAGSAAQLIAMAADEVQMAEDAFQFIHHTQGWAGGDYRVMQSTAADLITIDKRLASVLERRTGKASGDVYAWMDAEAILDYDTCKEMGVADVKISADNIAEQRMQIEKTDETQDLILASKSLLNEIQNGAKYVN